MAGTPLSLLRSRLASALSAMSERLDPAPLTDPPREGHSRLPLEALTEVHAGTLRYSYKGAPFPTSPFDLALLQLLVTRLRPAKIVEISSGTAGRALWLADQLRVHGIAGGVVSASPRPPSDIAHHAVTFVRADVSALERSPLPEVLATCPRPLVVIEDGPHTHEASRAALDFFHPHLQRGDYVVVCGGIVADLGLDRFDDGPHRAVIEHLRSHPGQYTIDRDLCDWFGRNATWNPDGYLRRE